MKTLKLALLIAATLTLASGPALAAHPTVTVKNHGSTTADYIFWWETAVITIEVTPGFLSPGQSVDVWVLLGDSNTDETFYFDHAPLALGKAGWKQVGPSQQPAHHGPLPAKLEIEVFDMFLPVGDYAFMVALDAIGDKTFNDGLAWGAMEVHVMGGTPPDFPGTQYIPEGVFSMGNHNDPQDHFVFEKPVHNVALDAFLMDRYEVTKQEYVAFLNAAKSAGTIVVDNQNRVRRNVTGGGGKIYCLTSASASGPDIKWNGTTFSVSSAQSSHPMTLVTWHGAAAYCNWKSLQAGLPPAYDLSTWNCDYTKGGFRLPTEAEWEYAARGGAYLPYYKYPWNSNSLTSSDANYDDGSSGYKTKPVGSYNDNGYGLFDMVGNVNEWCNDWFDQGYYKATTTPESNPKGPSAGVWPYTDHRVMRGGSFVNVGNHARSAWRGHEREWDAKSSIGFRKVKNGFPYQF
jgi:formylglycine-generating enzyme required for sulfatase activity